MSPLRHLLVPRDFSPPSEAALHLALRLASGADATLHLVHVEVLRDDVYGSQGAASPAAKLRERLKEVVEGDRAVAPPYDPESVRMEHAVVRGAAAGPAVRQYAEDNGIDLVVMGRHGRRGLRRAVLGSVAEHVVREAPCPVAAVPAEYSPNMVDPSVFAAVDFAAPSAAVAGLAARLAAALGAQLDLLHVADASAPDSGEVAWDRLAALADAALEAMGENRPAVRCHVRTGRADEQILEAVAQARPNLLVVGPRNREGLGRLLGSVADRAVREAPCPVVVGRAAEA